MKIIILLILAGLILAQEEFKCREEPSPKGIEDCSLYALANYRESAKAFTIYLCQYQGLFDDNLAQYNQTAAYLMNAMYCSGCPPDILLGQNETFAGFLSKIAKDIKLIGEPVGKVADIFDFTQPETDMFCYLEEDAITSQCLSDVIESDLPEDVSIVKKLLCKDDATWQDVKETLEDSSCFLDKASHTNGALENVSEGTGLLLQYASEDFREKLKKKLEKRNITPGLLCLLGDLENDLTNGGGSDFIDRAGEFLSSTTGGGNGIIHGLTD